MVPCGGGVVRRFWTQKPGPNNLTPNWLGATLPLLLDPLEPQCGYPTDVSLRKNDATRAERIEGGNVRIVDVGEIG